MNGIWNRSPAIILRFILAFTLALLVGGMGGGDENLSGGLLTEAYIDLRNWLHSATENHEGPKIEFLMDHLDRV